MSISQYQRGIAGILTRSRYLRSNGCSGLALTLAIAAAAGAVSVVPAAAQDLSSFAVLAGAGITSTGATTITGNVGTWPTSTITGKDGLQNFITLTETENAFYEGGAVAQGAQAQLTTLYNALFARPTSVNGNLSGVDLGTYNAMNPLLPGVYQFDSTAQLTGTLRLDGLGDPNAVFVFKIGSSLTTASGAQIELVNGASGDNVFFQVGSSATLGTSTVFNGQIVALTAISVQTSATIPCGAVLARR